MKIKDRVIELLSDKYCGLLPIKSIHEEDTIIDIGFDSLRFMEFVVLIEEEYHIEFPDDLLDIQSTTTVREVIERLEKEV
ncbi:acyl carrier protein [Oceanobacillus profundus]|uniref:Acyl carrier protein n=1 Tax=Oceanobacillus profundus TaxID=372463 RepID=A0A417YHZ5_9BACI|nr:acyl carrier protein [Oceanobacillus profundus]MCM3399769.1 acyl carrier protein [Oceanobacillus profundus]MDO6449979.1 acyl carrier protein [Oceanobacillus profundus]PAE28194.1 phosphopantetheine attachment protein [Paenibacillus sp. 7884-2]RHW32580.1 acyl carrier protein [Oceanobacillus profundus]